MAKELGLRIPGISRGLDLGRKALSSIHSNEEVESRRQGELRVALGAEFSARIQEARASRDTRAFVIWEGNKFKEPWIGPLIKYEQHDTTYGKLVSTSQELKNGKKLLALVILCPGELCIKDGDKIRVLSEINTISPRYKDTILVSGEFNQESIELEFIQESRDLRTSFDYRNRLENAIRTHDKATNHSLHKISLPTSSPVIQEEQIKTLLQKFAPL